MSRQMGLIPFRRGPGCPRAIQVVGEAPNSLPVVRIIPGRAGIFQRHVEPFFAGYTVSPIISRTSVSRPVTAAAAAMAGLIRWVRPPRP